MVTEWHGLLSTKGVHVNPDRTKNLSESPVECLYRTIHTSIITIIDNRKEAMNKIALETQPGTSGDELRNGGNCEDEVVSAKDSLLSDHDNGKASSVE